MNNRILLICILLIVGVFCDVFAVEAFRAKLAVRKSVTDDRWPADVPIRICALRVQFVEDDITGTTGTGKMGSGFDSSLTIDPLPHDRAYFEDHLSFLKHYYETVSKHHLQFETMTVFPALDTAVYQLEYPMWHYNYNNGDDELLNRRLTELFVQSVGKAVDVDFSLFNAIIVFHAGTGKDFNLGYDTTPFDIPSAYISEADIHRYAPGAVLPNGVTRGIILPEGENQAEALELDIELSLNGIMVKLFGNWLGLPDLFDTKTGNSGIGRWGMMDQGSGNVSALVPAMPDAWSRVFMGWEEAHNVVPSGIGDTVRVARFGYSAAKQIICFPVTPQEYYLVENRYSDPDTVGDTAYVVLHDRANRSLWVNHYGEFIVEQGFRVAVKASHYDFGIPGSGLLIWHIDETVIASGLTDNSVNTDPDHRGVDLVEADGAQDIGRSYGFASPGSGTELGIAEDAWYYNNKEHRAANRDALIDRFSGRTYPSARFYDGSYTRLEFTNISPVDTVMSFMARTEGMLPGFPVSFTDPVEWAVADLDGDSIKDIYFLSNDSLYQRDSLLMPVSQTIAFAEACPVTDLDGDGRDELIFERYCIGIGYLDGGSIYIRYSDPANSIEQKVYPARNPDGTGALLITSHTQDSVRIIWSSLSFETLAEWRLPISTSYSVLNVESFPARRFIIVSQGYAELIQSPHLDFAWTGTIEDSRIAGTGIIVAEPDTQTVFLTGLGYVNIADGTVMCYVPECFPPVEDWDQDGIPDGGGRFGRQDVPQENAPRFNADIVRICDLEADGYPDLLGFSELNHWERTPVCSRISAVSHGGVSYPDFPIAGAAATNRDLFLWDHSQTLYYLTITRANNEYYCGVNRLLNAYGTQRFAFREPVNLINVGPLRPSVHLRENWVYCWPNPASDRSRIRITLPYPARATAKIFDLTGRQIALLNGESDLAGAFEIVWNVEKVESGVYLARVEAEGRNQTRDSQIKIAVVK